MAAANEKTTYTAAEVAALESRIQQQQDEIDALKKKLDHMNEVFANAQRARFGQSSEKAAYVLAEDQMSLFNEAEKYQDHKAEEPTEETFTVNAHTRKKKKTIDEMAKNLPVEEVLLKLPESQLICEKCGGTFKPIGRKFVRREMLVIPRQVKILEYYTVTYACDRCEKDTGFAHMKSVHAPAPLMKHSLASASSVADVMTKKYVDGLPLARQEKIWAREGVQLSRATMANWVIQCTQTWLKPLYKHMKQQLLAQPVIHADETVVQVLKEDGKPATSESRMWLYASGERSEMPVRRQPDRSGKRPESFLKGFAGCLVTDGYAGYNQVAKVTHC
ncbi:MAG: IS66 family transposase [Oscillospiraceae bacterium]|nr:IS66 family transposase [Oscillospiraceae bacterium]